MLPRQTTACLLLPMLLAACPERTALWILPGSTVDSLVFAIGERLGHEKPLSFTYLLVDGCDSPSRGRLDSPTGWAIVRSGGDLGTPGYPTRVRYGMVPAGFDSVRTAPALLPGCYVADIIGTGGVAFNVRGDGTVLALDTMPPWPEASAAAAASRTQSSP
jgi:hypothetical protein